MENIKKFLNEKQDPKAVEKVLSKVTELLTNEEEVVYVAVQKKPAINLSPDSLVLTNKRIIFCRPKTLGLSMSFQDYQWKHVYDCHMKEGIMGATFSIRLINKVTNYMDYLPKAQARVLYRFAQEKEEKMAEYRRERELEKTRAVAGGGIVVQTSDTLHKSENGEEDVVVKIKKLNNLLENNLISQDEFEAKRKELLATI